MLLAPAGVNAATPIVAVGGTGPTPGTISYGEPVAFAPTLTNKDTSTFSLTLTTSDQTLVVLSATATGGTCLQTTPLSCTFKNVKPTATVSALVVLQAPSTGTGFNVQFKWDTTGVAGDKGGNSHGDSFYWPNNGTNTDNTTFLPVGLKNDANFHARYVLTNKQTTIGDDQTVGTGNPQATQVIVGSTGFDVTVSDGVIDKNFCGLGLSCFGDTSTIQVNGDIGQLPGGGWFRVVLTLDSSEIASGINANNITIYHRLNDGSEENISASCTLSGGVPTNTTACIIVKKLPGNDLQVTIWTKNNGFMKPA
jgi:hypothetical protein